VIEINPNALYTRADLAEMLAPVGIDADTFVARLKPKRVFRMAWLGKHIVEAFDAAPVLAERGDAGGGVSLPAAQNKGNRTRRGGHVDDAPGAKLRAFRKELLAAHGTD
jgi:hypothetical protein